MKKIVVMSLLFSCFVICSMDKKEDRKKDSLSSPQGSKKRNKSSSDTSAPVRKVDSLDPICKMKLGKRWEIKKHLS